MTGSGRPWLLFSIHSVGSKGYFTLLVSILIASILIGMAAAMGVLESVGAGVSVITG